MIEKLSDLLMKNKFLASKVNRKTVPQFIKYLVVGFSSTFIELVIFEFLHYYFLPGRIPNEITLSLMGMLLFIPHIITLSANTIAYTVVFIYNYTLQRKWAFKSTANFKKQMMQYGILFGFNLIVSNYLVIFLISFMQNYVFSGMEYLLFVPLKAAIFIPLIAKVMSIAFVVSWNFVVYKKIIFKK